MKVYIVHCGYSQNPQTKEVRPANVVTFRVNREEAEELAEFLHKKYADLRYHVYLASNSNEAMGGGVEKLLKNDTDEEKQRYREEVENNEMRYQCSELNLEGADAELLLREIAKVDVNGARALAYAGK